MNKQFIKIIFILMGISMLTAKAYRGGELRTINTYRYGRYEVRMKSAQGSGESVLFLPIGITGLMDTRVHNTGMKLI
jgi:hypothetical protein